MDSKGLREFRLDFPFLESFLSAPLSGMRPVWDLKQFITINQPYEFPPIQAVEVYFGFGNCRTFEETCILMEIYKKVLLTADLDPLKLHDACLVGELFKFVKIYCEVDERYRRLLENVHPL